MESSPFAFSPEPFSLPKSPAVDWAFKDLYNTGSDGKCDKEPGFMRMGSLNSKMKKGSMFSSGGRAITRMKSWGSADNIQDRAVNMMPPPKTYPKKKKSRKHADIVALSENWRGKSGDSDSDSASGVIS